MVICPNCGERMTPEVKRNSDLDDIIRYLCGCDASSDWILLDLVEE